MNIWGFGTFLKSTSVVLWRCPSFFSCYQNISQVLSTPEFEPQTLRFEAWNRLPVPQMTTVFFNQWIGLEHDCIVLPTIINQQWQWVLQNQAFSEPVASWIRGGPSSRSQQKVQMTILKLKRQVLHFHQHSYLKWHQIDIKRKSKTNLLLKLTKPSTNLREENYHKCQCEALWKAEGKTISISRWFMYNLWRSTAGYFCHQ